MGSSTIARGLRRGTWLGVVTCLRVVRVAILGVSVGFALVHLVGQVSAPVPPPSQGPSLSWPGERPGQPEAFPGLEHSREVARAKERQRRMVDDANRLVALSAQYREAVDKHGTPTPDDAKLLLEIERLARSVKDRMRGM